MDRKFEYGCTWQALLLNRKLDKSMIPIDVTKFKSIKNHIGLHGYRRAKGHDDANIRAYKKDLYGVVLVYINMEERTVECKSETWSGLMGICGEFDLSTYKKV